MNHQILLQALIQIDYFNAEQYRTLVDLGLIPDDCEPYEWSEALLALQLAYKLRPADPTVDPLDRYDPPSVDEYLTRLGDRVKAIQATISVGVTA